VVAEKREAFGLVGSAELVQEQPSSDTQSGNPRARLVEPTLVMNSLFTVRY
jgi:hypothetical protein